MTATTITRTLYPPRRLSPLAFDTPPATGSENPVENPLQKLVRSRLAELGTPGKPMSAREASKRSRGGVSYDSIYLILNGKHSGKVTDAVAHGLALALDLPVSKIYDAAGAPRAQGRWTLPERFDRLTVEQRRLFEDMMGMVLKADEDGYERGRREAENPV